MTLTADRLRILLDYDSDTGVFTRKVRTSNSVHIGDVAGDNNRGYLRFSVDGKRYLAHRLAWLYTYGIWPSGDLDHKNGITHDNRISNLRDVTQLQNMQNQSSAHRGNTSGYLGVSPNRDKWQASIRLDGAQRYLGVFSTPELASEAYLAAKKKFHEFWVDKS